MLGSILRLKLTRRALQKQKQYGAAAELYQRAHSGYKKALGLGHPTLQASIIAIRDTQTLQQHHAIMEWLSPTDFPVQQHDIISWKQDGTLLLRYP
jgi:hypothetical protein